MDDKIRPNDRIEIKGKTYRVAAMNYAGKLILHPVVSGEKESTMDMMRRLQSTEPLDATEPVEPQKP